jgi:hypothetical protein
VERLKPSCEGSVTEGLMTPERKARGQAPCRGLMTPLSEDLLYLSLLLELLYEAHCGAVRVLADGAWEQTGEESGDKGLVTRRQFSFLL